MRGSDLRVSDIGIWDRMSGWFVGEPTVVDGRWPCPTEGCEGDEAGLPPQEAEGRKMSEHIQNLSNSFFLAGILGACLCLPLLWFEVVDSIDRRNNRLAKKPKGGK